MKYVWDHDLHIHSQLSLCSGDPEQTTASILQYAQKEGLHTVCLTDHFWDERVPGASPWYAQQDFAHIRAALPLPQAEGVRFLFGCETEMDLHGQIGLSDGRLDLFDFIIIPTTHFHMTGFTVPATATTPGDRAALWLQRLHALLDRPLPFHRVGVAHLTCSLIAQGDRATYLATLDALREEELCAVFGRAAQAGVGIELNLFDMSFAAEEAETVLRPYRIAHRMGCRFYCGTDAHTPADWKNARAVFSRAIDLLGLTEEDKFLPGA